MYIILYLYKYLYFVVVNSFYIYANWNAACEFVHMVLLGAIICVWVFACIMPNRHVDAADHQRLVNKPPSTRKLAHVMKLLWGFIDHRVLWAKVCNCVRSSSKPISWCFNQLLGLLASFNHGVCVCVWSLSYEIFQYNGAAVRRTMIVL